MAHHLPARHHMSPLYQNACIFASSYLGEGGVGIEGGASSDTTVHVCHAQVIQTQRHCQSAEKRRAEYHTAVQYRSESVLCENGKVGTTEKVVCHGTLIKKRANSAQTGKTPQLSIVKRTKEKHTTEYSHTPVCVGLVCWHHVVPVEYAHLEYDAICAHTHVHHCGKRQ